METFSKKTHGSMPLGKKKMMLKVLWERIFCDVEAPAPVITFKTCSNPSFVQVKHHHGTTTRDNPSQPDTTHELYTLQKNIWSFPTAKRQNAIYPSKSMPRPARSWRCFLKMCVCG